MPPEDANSPAVDEGKDIEVFRSDYRFSAYKVTRDLDGNIHVRKKPKTQPEFWSRRAIRQTSVRFVS